MYWQQALVRASAAWAEEKGGTHQKHYKVKMNLSICAMDKSYPTLQLTSEPLSNRKTAPRKPESIVWDQKEGAISVHVIY
jgi:hypothetical protein